MAALDWMACAAPGAETIDVHAHASGAGGGELAEARWFTRDQARCPVTATLAPLLACRIAGMPPTIHHTTAATGDHRFPATLAARAQVRMMLERAAGKRKDGPQAEVVPPPLAIAYHLIERWCERTLF
jgi:hypothetical protein